MEKKTLNYLIKCITVASMIFMMLFSNIISIISFAAEGTTNEIDESNERVKFDIRWNNTNVNAGSKYAIGFNVVLSSVESGFRNLMIAVDDTTTPRATIDAKGGISSDTYFDLSKSTGRYLKFKKNIDGGVEIDGTIPVIFASAQDFQNYNKEIKITLTGEYDDPITKDVQRFCIEKTISANVKTPEYNDKCSAEVEIDNDFSSSQRSSQGWAQGEYMVTTLSAHTRLYLGGHNIGYGEYKYTTYRTSNDANKSAINSEDNMSITVNNCPSVIQYTIDRKNDGTTDIIFRVGEDKEEYTEKDLYDLGSNIDIYVTYKIFENDGKSPSDGFGSSTISASCAGSVKGLDMKKNSEGTFFTPKQHNFQRGNSENFGLGYKVGDYLASAKISSGETLRSTWEEKVENGTVDINYTTDCLYWDRRPTAQKEKLVVNSWNGEDSMSLTYLADGGTRETIKLNSDEFKLKEINVNTIDFRNIEFVKFIKKGETEPFFTMNIREGTTRFVADENDDINDYYAEFDYMYGVKVNAYPRWIATYTLNIDKLKERLSEDEIKNVISITKYQYGENFGGSDINKNTSAPHNIYTPTKTVITPNSFFDITCNKTVGNDVVNTMNSSIGQYRQETDGQIVLRMYKDTEKMGTNIKLKNENPKFYVKLPEIFDYDDIQVRTSSDRLIISNQNCTDPDEKAWYINDDGYLVINCVGTWTDDNGSLNIYITFKKKLNTYTAPANNKIYAYMITDNARYYSNILTNNVSYFTKNGASPATIGFNDVGFSIVGEDSVKIRNGIVRNNADFFPSAASTDKLGTKENAIKAMEGETVKYKTELATNGKRISSINIVSRLPMANNNTITGTTYSLESDISLNNLKNIEVKLVNNGTESAVDSSKYKIYYSTDIDAGFDSSFVEYAEGDANISNAKTIQVKFVDNFVLEGSQKIHIYYEMDMQNQEGMAGQISAVKYKNDDNREQTLEPAAVYVQKGNPNGTLDLQKLFEGYAVENAPSNVSLQGIKFKLKNIKTKEILVIEGQTDANGNFETDEYGRIHLENIPIGRYEIVEASEFNEFDQIPYTSFEIINGESISKDVTNPRKYGKIIVKKHWATPEENADVQQGTVSFKATRTGDLINYSGTAWTNSNGEAEFYVKYGTYTIEESQGLTGWKMSCVPANVTLNQEVVEHNVGNYLPKTTLKITKTVPSESSDDTVRGISFHIKGYAYADTYKTTTGDKVDLVYDETIVVGEDSNENIKQEIADDNKSVVITINNIYAGNYTITEMDMPTVNVDGENVKRYVDLVRTISLEPETVNNLLLQNVWKKGTVKIKKTAAEGVELDQFKFRVHGTSYYGTEVDEIIKINEEGYGFGSVLLGEYTIEEVDADAFDATYTLVVDGKEVTTKDSATIKVDGKSVVNVNVDNQNVGGYVEIIKKMEFDTDASKAENIKFEINGLAPSGANVHEEITIKKHEENGTIVYKGKSKSIPAGGEYELTEVESTVPSNYEIMDPMPVKITKKNTEENPLVLNIENKKGRGNLFISTETIPEGGEVYPIVYKIQEINLDEKSGTYTRIPGTEQTADGDLAGRKSYIDLLSGTYIVEQLSVPKGWKKDVPQIVDVPIEDDANVVFIIEKEEQLENTKVTITKSIINSNGETATDADFSKNKLKKNESFEVKLTSKETGKEYFTFISPTRDGIIEGLPVGRYTVEEVYKPKYIVESYNLVESTDEQIQSDSGEFIIEVGDEESGKNEVKVHIVNKINDQFGFGGQDSKENLSAIDAEKFEEIQNAVISRAVVVVADEDGNKIDGCTFELYNSNGEKILDFVPKAKQTVIKGLDPGIYTVKNTVVPSGYLLAEDTYITVYEDAVRTKRIEIQKNIPRGSLTLKTTYVKGEETRFVPKSKYQIVNSTTGDLLTFVRNVDGSYKRSNSADAVNTISLRAGAVTVSGIETDTYEVGIVDITNGYGIDKTDVEVVEIIQNETQEIEVEASKKYLVDIKSGYDQAYALDNDGILWAWGYGYYGIGNGTKDLYTPEIIERNVEKISAGYYAKALITKDGVLKVWGYNNYSCLGINSSDTSYVIPEPSGNSAMQGKKAIDVSAGYQSLLVLDEDYKLWYAGDRYSCGLGQDYENNTLKENVKLLTCISDIEGSPFKNINIRKVFAGYYFNAVIDDQGRLWTWNHGSSGYLGYNPTNSSECYAPKCVSLTEGNDIYEAYKQGKKIVDVCGNAALDEDGNVYVFSTYYGYSPYAMLIEKYESSFKGKTFKKIASNVYSNTYKLALIDEDGQLYVNFECLTNKENSKFNNVNFENVCVGYNTVIGYDQNSDLYACASYTNDYGQTGGYRENYELEYRYNGNKLVEYQFSIPNYTAHFKYDMKFEKVVSNYYATTALDEDGRLWSWGYGYYNATGNSIDYNYEPRRIEFSTELRFKDIAANKDSYYQTYAIDTDGRLWTWGYSGSNYMSGAGGTANGMYMNKTCISDLDYLNNPLAIAYKDGIKLEEIKASYYCMMAKDNQNKLWVWGNYATNFASGIDPTVPTCLSDIGELKALYDRGLYIKKYEYFDNGLVFIDNEGTLWFMKNGVITTLADVYTEENAEKTLLAKDVAENGTKIVDISSCYSSYLAILDDKGMVWYKNSLNEDKCYTTVEDSALANAYTDGIKIVSLSETIYGTNNLFGIDSLGRIWSIYYDKIVADSTEYIYIHQYNGDYFAIDKDKHLWVWGSNNYGRLGVGTNLSVENPTCTTTAFENVLYGVKFKNIIGDGSIESEDGYIYKIKNYSWYKAYQSVTYLENQGIEIKQEYGNYVLDTNGKLYYGNSEDINKGEWRCVTDEEDCDLYDEYYNNDVQIKEIIAGTYFLDTQDRLWGTNFKLVGDFEYDTTVATTNNNRIVKDKDGNYWINGSNGYGLLGNDGASVDVAGQFIKITLDEDTNIDEIIFFDDRCIYIKDNNGYVWSWGNNYDCMMGISDSTSIVKTPLNWGIQAQDVYVIRYDNYSGGYPYSVFVLDTDGQVWSCGYGTGNDWASGALGKYSRTLGKVNNSESMGKIVKLTVAADCCYAINEDGDLWVWGDNAYGALGYETSLVYRYYNSNNSNIHYYTFDTITNAVCVTKSISSVYYGKKIKDVISLTGWYTYTSDINKGVYEAGNAEVLVVTEEDEYYRMGNKGKVVNKACVDMYEGRPNCSASYPKPELVDIDGNIVDIKYRSAKEMYLQTDTGAVYFSDGTCYNGYNNWHGNSSYFYSISKDEYIGKTLDEVYEMRYPKSTLEITINNSNHSIRYKSTGRFSYDNVDKTYSFPATITAVKAYVDSDGDPMYIIDSEGNIWIKGTSESWRGTGMGKSYNTLTCVTTMKNTTEPIWNRIRGRWNIIPRKY